MAVRNLASTFKYKDWRDASTASMETNLSEKVHVMIKQNCVLMGELSAPIRTLGIFQPH